jgi:hypothetical protein
MLLSGRTVHVVEDGGETYLVETKRLAGQRG